MTGLTVQVDDLSHRYATVEGDVPVLDDVSFALSAGSAAAISGPSGSGKSTLTNILAGLLRPTSGTVFIGDAELAQLSERALTRLRAQHLAVVPQNPDRNLIGWASAEQNLRFAQRAARALGRRSLPEPSRLLARLGLEAEAGARVDRLSGGQRQRLALASGLAAAPDVLLIDEPTSQLDADAASSVVQVLLAEAATGTTVVAVTHDELVAEQMNLRLALRDGRLQS